LVCAAATVTAQGTLQFEVASVRPNTGSDLNVPSRPQPPDGLVYVNYPLYQIVLNAYSVQPFRVTGMPGWAFEARYDINAKASGPITEPQRRQMLQALLADRFNMKSRIESREQTVYVMTRLRQDGLGLGLKPRPDCAGVPPPCAPTGGAGRLVGYLRGQAMPMSQVERMLTLVLEQVVYDETKIEGLFDVDVSWRPPNAPLDDPRPASVFTAVEEQLGLKLTPQRRPVDFLIVESLDRATPQQ
jgi:uncharacterized protein (TIGR03435 family)